MMTTCNKIYHLYKNAYIFRYIHVQVLSCQPRVTVTSCLVYKVVRDLESINHLCIKTQVIYRFALAQWLYKLMFCLTIENKK